MHRRRDAVTRCDVSGDDCADDVAVALGNEQRSAWRGHEALHVGRLVEDRASGVGVAVPEGQHSVDVLCGRLADFDGHAAEWRPKAASHS